MSNPQQERPRRTRIGWICNSAVTPSETFLVDNLEMMQSFADVLAFSGNASTANPSIQSLSFDALNQKPHHVLTRKLTGINLRTIQKRLQCSNQLLPKFKAFAPDVLWIEFGTTAHVASTLISRLKKPYIISVHGFDITFSMHDRRYRREFVQIANNAAKIICASRYAQKLLIDSGVSPDKCTLIRLAVTDKKGQVTPKTNHPSFLYVGRFVEVKGPLQLIYSFQQASKELNDATLTMIGEGPLLHEAIELVKTLDIKDQVTFLGALNHEETKRIMTSHWILCQSGVTSDTGQQEAFGLSLAEAALIGLPVIATRFGGIPEHVIHGTTGLLLDEGDVAGFAQAMIELGKNKEKTHSFGKAGQDNIKHLCSPSKRRAEVQALVASCT